MEAFGKLTGVIISLIVFTLIRGLVIMKGWLWFVVPFGVPVIGLAWAIGLACVTNLMTGVNQNSSTTSYNSVVEFIVYIVTHSIAYLAALGVMWIVTLFM